MLPSSDAGAGPGRSALRRWGPLVAIVAVVALVGGALVLSSGDDDGSSTATTAAGAGAVGDDLPDGVLPFSVAEAEGIDVDWPDTCDTERGTVAYPSFFAPECYAPFTGDNGGATDEGVTADRIKVVWYLAPDVDPIIDFISEGISNDTAADTRATLEGFNEFFGHFAETYGREVELEFYEATGTADDEIAARADAVAIAEDLAPFMVLNGPQLTAAFEEELAARGVSCLQCGPTQPQSFYEEADPYLLTVTMNNEQGQYHTAAFLGSQLAGRPAEFAGDDLADQERQFGLVYLDSIENSDEALDTFEERLDEQGITLAEEVAYDSPVTLQTSAPNVIAKLKDAGVTSVIFVGDPVAPRELTREATAQDYFPEWIITPASVLVDTNVFARTYDQEQWAHAMGVITGAAKTDPSTQGSAFLYEWYFGEEPPADDTVALLSAQLNTFYNVVQGVGPNLTRQSFRDAIFAGQPTPSAVTQPSLSWGDKGIWPGTDWLGIDDTTLVWWNPDAEGPDERGDVAAGMYEFVDGGVRYLPDEWPDEALGLFDPDGAVTIYEEPPESEAPPEYPSPAR
ncbi:MAG: ABC transporter substrate-binding protein [Acidimicrobiales bacterium]|nr:ABC transporter substrate-binding protein [Acidimicrobiales bacterium]MCB9372844.1 ABC transporter substrate-binding protein [Microthrixaceae bacterium]